MRGEVAGIIDLAGRGLVGHRARGDEVLAPDRFRSHPELARGRIHQPLDDIGGFGPARAAIGVDRHRVGEDGADPAMERLDIVEARQHPGAAMGDIGREGREIGAHVADQVDVHGEEAAILRQRHFRRGEIVAALGIAHEMLGAIGGPADRLLQLARDNRQQRIFAIGKQLGAKAAAHVRADHAHVLDRNLQDVLAQDIAQAVAALAARRQRQMIALGVIFADRRAGLHEACNDARIDDGDFGDRMRLGEGRVRRLLVADRHVEQHVAGMIAPDLRGILLDRIGDAGDGGQRGPVDLDRLDGVAGLIGALGHHEGHGVADVTHLAIGQDRIGRRREGIGLEIEQAGQPAEIPDVFRGQDRSDARQRTGLGRIDGESRMGMGRAQHHRMQRGRRREVVGVATLAADERVVFLAQNALTDAEFDGSSHPISTLSSLILRHIAADRGIVQRV